MFKRGEGPLTSIIMPTRGRPDMLEESIISIHDNCMDKSRIEYCLKIDEDDTQVRDKAFAMSKNLPMRILISPRGRGYYELHQYVNDLSSIARGDWLFIFNDDARMLTKDWDEVLFQANPHVLPKFGGSNDICLLGPQVVEREISWEFPILRRKTFQTLGHFSKHISTDSYIYWVMAGINAAVTIHDIKITHMINDIQDEVKVEGRKAINDNMKVFDSPEIQQLQELDRRKLTTYMLEEFRR